MHLAVIFDLDGTLVNTLQGIVETYIAALKSMDITCIERPMIRGTIGLPLEQGFSSLLGVSQDDDKVIYGIQQYHILYKEIVLAKAKELVFSGVAEGLALLRKQGIQLAVATVSVYKNAEALLKEAGLWQYFSCVVGVDQVVQPKPHPEMGQLIMKKLNVTADYTIMVGDSAHDILMAKNAGMRSIAVTYGIHEVQKLQLSEPTWMADSFHDVLSHLVGSETLKKQQDSFPI